MAWWDGHSSAKLNVAEAIGHHLLLDRGLLVVREGGHFGIRHHGHSPYPLVRGRICSSLTNICRKHPLHSNRLPLVNRLAEGLVLELHRNICALSSSRLVDTSIAAPSLHRLPPPIVRYLLLQVGGTGALFFLFAFFDCLVLFLTSVHFARRLDAETLCFDLGNQFL